MSADGEICELKIGSGRKMITMKSPKVIWDDFLELEAYICSKMDFDFFDLDEMTPETKMSG